MSSDFEEHMVSAFNAMHAPLTDEERNSAEIILRSLFQVKPSTHHFVFSLQCWQSLAIARMHDAWARYVRGELRLENALAAVHENANEIVKNEIVKREIVKREIVKREIVKREKLRLPPGEHPIHQIIELAAELEERVGNVSFAKGDATETERMIRQVAWVGWTIDTILSLCALPHTERGEKVIQSARLGHAMIYGTNEEKNEQRNQIRARWDEIHSSDPDLKKGDIDQAVADELFVKPKTVQRARLKS